MPSITTLLPKLTADFPTLNFAAGKESHWDPTTQTVYYLGGDVEQLLHELSHAVLGHAGYRRDVELVAMERDAWEKAREVAPTYGVTITDDAVQNHLDTYRDWLHDRSECPSCRATGRQTAGKAYHCDACGQDWQVNEARMCGLKRYKSSN